MHWNVLVRGSGSAVAEAVRRNETSPAGNRGEVVLSRFSRRHQAGGQNRWLRTMLMLVTTIALAIAEFGCFRGICCGLVAIAVTSLGWFFRTSIAELGSGFPFLYGILFFAVERAGCGIQTKLVVIAFACIVMFNLNFWWVTEAKTPQP